MENILELIKNRRTTRTFKEKMISEEELEKIIEAGMWAPSGHNRQPWHFTIIENREIMNKINLDTKEACKDSDDPLYYGWANSKNYDAFYNAPVLVMLSYRDDGFSPVDDLGAASQNMGLAAEYLGVGSCWIGFINKLFEKNEKKQEEYRKLLNIPENYTIHHGIVFGYSEKEKLKPKKRIGTFNRI
ncbi:MAG: nitroreductase family protein [Fusobacteriaceae bacterium]